MSRHKVDVVKKENIYTYDKLINVYEVSCDNIDVNKIQLGFPDLERGIRYLRRQELMTLISKTGIGKSILGMNFGVNWLNLSKYGLLAVFSLEMSAPSNAERCIQLAIEESGENIEDAFVTKNMSFINRARKAKVFKDRLYLISERIDISQVSDYLHCVSDMGGQEVVLGIIDYVGIMKNKYHPGNEYSRTTDNMQRLYELVKEENMALINIAQVSREDGKSGMTVSSGKGSGEIENSSDFLFILDEVLDTTNIDIEQGYLHHIRTSGKPYTLLKISNGKIRRGKKKQTMYVLFNNDTIRMCEFNNTLLI